MPVTIRDIANKLGLSQPTISHILKGRGSFREETKQLVFKTAAEMGYRPNAAARAMRNNRTQQIGVFLANDPAQRDETPQNYHVILGLNDGLQTAGYSLTLVRYTDVYGLTPELPPAIRESMLDGVVVLNANVEAMELRLGRLFEHLVWADTGRTDKSACINVDEAEAGRLAAEALIEGGARKLTMLACNRPIPGQDRWHLPYSARDRERGAQAAADEAGVEIQFVQWALNYDRTFIATVLPHVRAPKTGILTFDVSRARLVQQLAMQHRLVPGQDFGLACCEDLPDLARNWPGLTRAGFDRYAFGEATSRLILALLQNDKKASRSHLFPVRLVTGDTA